MSYLVTSRSLRVSLDCQRSAWLDEPSPAAFVLAIEELLFLVCWS